MPRPLRIEYENAYYHVMNRGAGRRRIFHDTQYFEAFITTLAEAHARFRIEILCYCLMGNHYHLLVKTPQANLGRAMRHINGVYTQRHNRLRKTDGSLFRGRYKAICVEENSYQLQLSRYIHRNPLEAKFVDRLENYPWSSYRYFTSSEKSPEWLYPFDIWAQLGARSKKYEKYRHFVELGNDDELIQLYSKTNQVPYLGSEAFRDWAYQQREILIDEVDIVRKELVAFRPTIDEIAEKVAKVFKVDKAVIMTKGRLKGEAARARKAAMYLCQEHGDYRLKEIAMAFGLKRYGSVSTIIGAFRETLVGDRRLADKIKRLI